MSAVAPYDWRGFFVAHIDEIAPHPPNFVTPGGYALAFTAKPSALEKVVNTNRKLLDVRYSLGIVAKTDGTVLDVIDGYPAARAGVPPGDKTTGVNGRMFDGDGAQAQIDAALTSARNGSGIRLLVMGDRVYHNYLFDERGGPEYPHLVRVVNTPDVLSQIPAPKRPNAVTPNAVEAAPGK